MDITKMTPEQAIAFERCTDFLAEMIIKYGPELDLEALARERGAASHSDEQKKSVPDALDQSTKRGLYWNNTETINQFHVFNLRLKTFDISLSENEAFKKVQDRFGVSRDYINNNIWNYHAYEDYALYR